MSDERVFHKNIVKQSECRPDLCRCGRGYVRQNQRNCHVCHKLAQRTYRARRRNEFLRARLAREQAAIDRIAANIELSGGGQP